MYKKVIILLSCTLFFISCSSDNNIVKEGIINEKSFEVAPIINSDINIIENTTNKDIKSSNKKDISDEYSLDIIDQVLEKASKNPDNFANEEKALMNNTGSNLSIKDKEALDIIGKLFVGIGKIDEKNKIMEDLIFASFENPNDPIYTREEFEDLGFDITDLLENSFSEEYIIKMGYKIKDLKTP